ncbi:TolC family protein [Niabella hibiscisoli]|uniref:TolC family protein n=1 Tax=Niabella hibiscisoli TaxID=1825928 RepID=UPI001F0D390C|nr:TolC family protein [Niabella hibiscisoli]MCH5720433.1 TolC family protein [Niabella hibiscisoli]
MKKTCLIILFIITSILGVNAQQSIISDIDSVLLNKYINLAVQNYPLKKAADATLDKARIQKTIAAVGLLDMFNAGYFYSPTKNDALVIIPGGGSNGSSNIVTRGFQFGISMNLGNFLTKPAMIKSAKADYIIAQEQNKDFKNVLVNNVKGRYYAFLAARKMLELRALAASDLRGVFTNAQTQFKNNEVSIEVYTSTKNLLVEAEASNLSAEVDYLKAKNELEEIIGTRLENVR